MAKAHDDVILQKFVYVPETGAYKITTDPQYYYDRPWHSDLAEELEAEHRGAGSPGGDFWNMNTIQAYLLLEEGKNALDSQVLPADTIAALSDPIPSIIQAFTEEGYAPLRWYNARTKELTPISARLGSEEGEEEEEEPCSICGEYGHDEYDCPNDRCDYCGEQGHDESDCPQREEDERMPDYSHAQTYKFVYDPADDQFVTGDDPQTYYERPHHSDYMEDLADMNGNWDFDNHVSGYYYLEDASDDALAYKPVSGDTIVSTIPPHEGIIDAFREKGLNPHTWREATPYGSSHIDHPIVRKPQGKVALVVPNFPLSNS